MSTKKGSDSSKEVSIIEVQRGTIDFCILGMRPIILNRMSEKAWHELLLPRGRKNAAEKASSAKHNPIEEFRASAYKHSDEDAPTLLMHLSSAFKRAMQTAALDLPGAKKSQIGRLTWVEGDYVHIYGVPQIFMSITRSADMNRTPDVRTRAIVPQWAARVSVTYIKPVLKETAVINLMAAAGLQSGIGDWRQEKGSGNYGAFQIVADDDLSFRSILKNGGRAAQVAAMELPEAYDDETAELLTWYDIEAKRRGFKVVS